MEFIVLFVVVAFIGIMIIIIADKYKKSEKEKTETKKSTRRNIKDVKPGELIWIESDRIKNKMGELKCLNNDPETKKILLQVRWRNYKETSSDEYEKFILDYNSKELMNFHLLNKLKMPSNQSKDDDDNDYDIITLQKKMNEAIEKQEYEIADELQKKIDKLSKKNK